MVFMAKFDPISAPELAFYGNDWKKYLEHYKLYMQFVTEHPEASKKLTLDTSCKPDKKQPDSYVRDLLKSPKQAEQQPLPSVVKKRDHGQVEYSPDDDISEYSAPGKADRPQGNVWFKSSNAEVPADKPEAPRPASQVSVEIPASPALLPEEKVKASRKKKVKKPQSPEERSRYLQSVYMDKVSGVMHDSSEKPSTADCILYLDKFLSKPAMNQLIREDRLPKTYKALNNLCDQCERLGGTELKLSQITDK